MVPASINISHRTGIGVQAHQTCLANTGIRCIPSSYRFKFSYLPLSEDSRSEMKSSRVQNTDIRSITSGTGTGTDIMSFSKPQRSTSSYRYLPIILQYRADVGTLEEAIVDQAPLRVLHVPYTVFMKDYLSIILQSCCCTDPG
jgi:hypothetical protein